MSKNIFNILFLVGVIFTFAIAIVHLQQEKEEIRIAEASARAEGYKSGQLKPTTEVHNQIFDKGWQSGLGQPTEILPDNEYVVLANISGEDMFAITKSKVMSREGYYLLVLNHIRAPDGSFNESAGAGWNGPQLIMVRK